VVHQLLIEGAIGGADLALVAFLLSRFARDIVGRSLLAVVLIVAALIYVVFAARGGAGTAWLAGELVGIALYGGIALLGLRRSPWWLAAGWALHPMWDILLHYVGPGHDFAPETYTIPCLTFDLTVAAYIALTYGVLKRHQRRPVRHRAAVVREPAL
jgi:hypothetical protein